MLGRDTRRLSVATAMAIALGVSAAVAADPADVEKLKATNNCVDCDLSGAVLRRTYLSGAKLSGAKLSDANLEWANLRDANLTNAKLTGANLSGANLCKTKILGYDGNRDCP